MSVAPNQRNGNSSQWPQLVTDDDNVFQYGVLIELDWNAVVFKRNIATGAIVSTYDLSLIAGNPLNLPVNSVDDHWALCIGIHRESGGDRLWIAGNSHSNNTTYQSRASGLRNCVYSNVDSISVWTDETVDLSIPGERLDDTSTYHKFVSADGYLIWMMSGGALTTSSLGRDWIAAVRTPGATTWTSLMAPNNAFFATTNAVTDGIEANRVYVSGTFIDHTGVFHCYGIYRTGDDDADTQKRPWYIKNAAAPWGKDDWTAVDGTAMTMPLTWANFTAAEITSAPALSRTVAQGIAVDSSGYPHVIVQDGSSSNFVRLTWNGSAWTSTAVGSPGTAVPPTPCSTPDGRVWFITQFERVRVTDPISGIAVANRSFNMGDVAPSGYEANPDPVGLVNGRLDLLIPNGDTPIVWSFGKGARSNV